MNDDLVSLFSGPPEQPSQDVRFRQGVIVTFDQVTLENTVLVGGTTLVDLPLLGVGEATLLVPGAVVGIMSVGASAKTMFITGRIVKPNTDDAEDAVSLLNSQIFTQHISTGESTSGTSYTDLATVGPQVTVPVGPTGRILLIATAQVQWSVAAAASTTGGGLFNVEFAGANTRSPVDVNDPLVGIPSLQIVTSAGNNSGFGIFSITTQAVFDALNPGNTIVTLKYRKSAAATGDPQFSRRTLTVFKL